MSDLVDDSKTRLQSLRRVDMMEVRHYKRPPAHVVECLAGLFMLLSGLAVRDSAGKNRGDYPKLKDIVKNCSDWGFVQALLGGNEAHVSRHLRELVESADLVCDRTTEHWAALEDHIERFPASFDFQTMRRKNTFTGCVCKIMRNLLHLRRLQRELESCLESETAPMTRPEIAAAIVAAWEKGNEKSKHELEASSSDTLKKVSGELDADTAAFRRSVSGLAACVRLVDEENERWNETKARNMTRMQQAEKALKQAQVSHAQARADVQAQLDRGVTRDQDRVRGVIIMRRTNHAPRPRGRHSDDSDEDTGWNGTAAGDRFAHNGWSRVGHVYDQSTYAAAFRDEMFANDNRTLLVCAPYKQGMFGARGKPGTVPGAETKSRLRRRPMCEGDPKFRLLLGERVEVREKARGKKARRRGTFTPGTGSCGRIAAITHAFDPKDWGEAGEVRPMLYAVRLDKDDYGAVLVENVSPERVFWLPYVEDGCRDPLVDVREEEE
jgi:hypothetical protein